MQNTKIIKFLKTLNQYEITQFKDFVNSPAFNKNKNVIKLFDELKKFYPKFKNDDLSEEIIYGKVFPGEKFDYFKLRNATSDLLVLGKEFFFYIKFKKSNIKDLFLLEELRKRNLDNIYEQTYKAAFKQNEEIKVKDEIYMYHKMNLTEELLSFNVIKKPNAIFHFQQDMLDIFIRYSLIRFLKFYDVMLHEGGQNNYKYKMGMFEEVLKYLKNNKIDDNPTLLVYYNIILLMKEKKDKNYYELKSLKTKYINELSARDRYMTWIHMNSYCVSMFNNCSRTDLLREQFELMKENTEDDTRKLGKILYPDFLNEVKIAVRVNEFKWAEDYIVRFSEKLEVEKESTLNFCYGYISYKKGDLDEALKLFSKTYFTLFIIKVQVKILQLQICFEKEYFDQAVSLIDSFRHYLKREVTIKEIFRMSFYEFLRLTNELIRLRTNYYGSDNDFYKEKLKNEISNLKNNQFGIKLWLKEKLNVESR